MHGKLVKAGLVEKRADAEPLPAEPPKPVIQLGDVPGRVPKRWSDKDGGKGFATDCGEVAGHNRQFGAVIGD
jgi:hypothetical protein